MIEAVDKVDSGNLTVDEILNPTGWILLGFVMDPRTGLGRFRNFTISNYALMEKLLEDVKERIALYNEQTALFKNMILEHTQIDGNVIVTDLRDVETIYTGNRFLIYSLYPEQNISLWIVDGGGGHEKVGTCQVPYDDADKVIKELIQAAQV